MIREFDKYQAASSKLKNRSLRNVSAKTLESEIAELEQQPTTDEQLKHALRGDVTCMIYQDFAKYSKIEDVFRDSLNVVVVFPVEKYNQGHYIAVLYYPDKNLVSVFDPYGYSLEEDINLADYLDHYDDRVKFALLTLLENFSGTVQVNRVPFQNKSDAIATCGKHCVMRILYRHIVDVEDYRKFLKYRNLTPDEIVTLMFL